MFKLSICIPTFNRAHLLLVTLESIISQIRFIESDDVQIVISDNNSDDDTEIICSRLIEKFNNKGDKIIYNKNERNLADKNFEIALSLGTGAFLKLNNDTLAHVSGSLDSMLNLLSENSTGEPILFFSNGKEYLDEKINGQNFNSFLRNAGGLVTFTGAFGIWREHFKKINDFSRRANLKLPHTDCLFRNFDMSATYCICNKKLFIIQDPGKKGGYDIITVFMENYIFLLREKLQEGLLSKEVFERERKAVLIDMVRPWMLNIIFYPELYTFTCKNATSRIFKCYSDNLIWISYFMLRLSFSFFLYATKMSIKMLLPVFILKRIRNACFSSR